MSYWDDDDVVLKPSGHVTRGLSNGSVTGSAFVQEVSGTSRIFGRDANISVVFEGDEAMTDGSTIIYPSIDQDAILTQEDLKIARGYVDHESAHIRHTDMDFFMDRAENAIKCGNALLKDMFNCVEDVRCERIVNQTYRGAKKNLSATAEAASQMYEEAYKADKSLSDDDKRITPLAFTWAGREDMDYSAPTVGKMLRTVSPQLQKALKKWVRELDGCKTTQDSYDLARRIVEDLNNEQYQEPDYQDMETGAGMGEDEEASDDGEEGEGAGGEGEEEGEANEENQEYDPYQSSLGNMMNNLFQNLENPTNKPYRPWSTRYDKVHTVHDKDARCGGTRANAGARILRARKSAKEYQRILANASGQINVMRRKLERAVQSTQRCDWDVGRIEGRLDTKRLPNAYNWHPNVYKRRVEAPALDTAISILVDQSGSMCGRRTETATQVSVALFECFQKIGVPFEILGWNNYEDFTDPKGKKAFHDAYRKHRSRHAQDWARIAPIHLYVYKSFTDKPQLAREVLATMPYNCSGFNSDGEAVAMAYERLKRRKEKRKIFMVLSDGQPACDGDGGLQKQYLRNVVARIENDGTDLIGIGIQSSAVKQFYPTWVVCNSIEDLPKACLDKIAKALMGQQFVVDNSELIQATK